MLFYCEERGETTMGLEARLLGRTKIYTDETIIDEETYYQSCEKLMQNTYLIADRCSF